MTSKQPPDRRWSVRLLGLIGLLLTAGCLAPVGTQINNPQSVAQQVETRYDALDEYQTTIERTVTVGDTAATTQAVVRFEKGESLQIAYRTGPNAGAVTVIDDPSPSNLLSTDAVAAQTAGAETPASYGAFAGHLVQSNNVTYRGTTVLNDHPAVVFSLEPTANEPAGQLTERRIWIDAERQVPLRIESTWVQDNRNVTETIRFTNTSLSVPNTADAARGITA